MYTQEQFGMGGIAERTTAREQVCKSKDWLCLGRDTRKVELMPHYLHEVWGEVRWGA